MWTNPENLVELIRILLELSRFLVESNGCELQLITETLLTWTKNSGHTFQPDFRFRVFTSHTIFGWFNSAFFRARIYKKFCFQQSIFSHGGKVILFPMCVTRYTWKHSGVNTLGEVHPVTLSAHPTGIVISRLIDTFSVLHFKRVIVNKLKHS